MVFSKEHVWVRQDGGAAVLGLSIFHAEELGDITFVKFPEVGKELKKDDVLCYIESIKAASDIYTPVSGKVIDVNHHLESAPEWINKDSEGEGWLIKMELSNPSELDTLLNHIDYEKFLTEDI